jgi:hypothetical protein
LIMATSCDNQQQYVTTAGMPNKFELVTKATGFARGTRARPAATPGRLRAPTHYCGWCVMGSSRAATVIWPCNRFEILTDRSLRSLQLGITRLRLPRLQHRSVRRPACRGGCDRNAISVDDRRTSPTIDKIFISFAHRERAAPSYPCIGRRVAAVVRNWWTP